MAKKITTYLIIALFLGMIGAQAGLGIIFYKAEFIPYDIGPELRSKDVTSFKPTNNGLPKSSAVTSEYYAVNDTVQWYALDSFNPDVTDEYYVTDFQLRKIGSVAEVWVQADLSFPENDPRDTPVITDAHVDQVLEDYEMNIYGTICDYFGDPDSHDGSLAELGQDYVEDNGRIVILISNIRDEYYYDDKYPYITVGFYWGVFERAFDRNIVTIGCLAYDDIIDWYLATLAHEFQHLVHDDYLPEDDLFMNEGCSMYAEPLCGYPLAYEDIEAFLATPDNSLTEWGDQGGINILADYGQALLWTVYLSDRFGENFLSDFITDGIGGIDGLNAALSSFGETFDTVFHDWRLANLLHTDAIGEGIYNYDSVDFDLVDPDWMRIYDIRRAFFDDKLGSDFGVTESYLRDKTTISKLGSYGTDYIKLINIKERFNPQFIFNGDDYSEFRVWNLMDQDGDGDKEWYSTVAGDEKDLLLSAEVDLSAYSTPILSFDTYYEIEGTWDFGFVQVSTDGGTTWTSLENAYTTTDFADGGYPAIYDNLPGLTGSSGGWINMEFDLSAYSSETEPILIGFRYMTDWAENEEGWYIDNIAIDGDIIEDGDTTNLFIGPDPEQTDFIVTLIGVNIIGGEEIYTQVTTLELDDLTEETLGGISLNEYVTADDGYVLVVVSTNRGLADYSFSVQRA